MVTRTPSRIKSVQDALAQLENNNFLKSSKEFTIDRLDQHIKIGNEQPHSVLVRQYVAPYGIHSTSRRYSEVLNKFRADLERMISIETDDKRYSAEQNGILYLGYLDYYATIQRIDGIDFRMKLQIFTVPFASMIEEINEGRLFVGENDTIRIDSIREYAFKPLK